MSHTPPHPPPGGPGAPDAPETDEAYLRGLLSRIAPHDKAALLTGADFWTLHPLPHIGLRPLRLSDGPNGVRGPVWDERDVSLLLPVAAALAATWDTGAAREAGRLFGDEARRRGVHAVLAPTLNLHRSPFGGRHFENFSEDPRLVAEIGAAVVDGVQERGVGATPKHFVANDTETGRMTYDARLSETALREVYLPPFETVVRRCRPWALMAAYNSVRGRTMTENGPLLTGVLRDEWGFDGVVVSDWFAARDTVRTARAGLDLAMPGPHGPWSGGRLAAAVETGEVPAEAVDEAVLRVLRLAARAGALTAPYEPESVPETAGGAVAGADVRPWTPPEFPPPPTEEARPAIRRLAARGFVLLRNEPPAPGSSPLLPLGRERLRRVAVIGENALLPAVQGGGSSHVSPAAVVTPLDGLRAAFGADGADGADAEVVYARGARHRRLLDPLPLARVTDPLGEGHGFRLDHLAADGTVLGSELRGTERLLWLGGEGMPEGTVTLRLRARVRLDGLDGPDVRPDGPGEHLFAVNGAGRAELSVAGRPVWSGELAPGGDPSVVRNAEDPIAPMLHPAEQRCPVTVAPGELDAAGTVALETVLHLPPEAPLVTLGTGYAYGPPESPDAAEMIAGAAQAARDADAVVLVVGTDDETETEGEDRTSLELPGAQNELTEAVLAANPRTVVAVNAGAPVLMPWAERAAALLWTWFGGQEYGHALADVLLGAREPGGRLPTTLPAALADVPVADTAPRPDGTLPYDEGTLVGHRAYAASGTSPLFPFGHGLGYTTWEYVGAEALAPADGAHASEAAAPQRTRHRAQQRVRLRVRLRNTGDRAGREVVQVYGLPPGAHEPPRLAAFGVAEADAGAETDTVIDVPESALARWDEERARWTTPPGTHVLHIGRSVTDRRLTLELTR